MKKGKRKAKWSGKRPVMFYQQGHKTKVYFLAGPRIRIIYPNGKALWLPLRKFNTWGDPCQEEWEISCWWGTPYGCRNLTAHKKPRSIDEALSQARWFDKRNKYKLPMEFLGEL